MRRLKISRLFSRSRWRLATSLILSFSFGVCSAEDTPWQMIDENEIPIEPLELPIAEIPLLRSDAAELSSWAASAQLVSLSRSDTLNLYWHDGVAEHNEDINTDINTGFRVALDREWIRSGSHTGLLTSASFLTVSGDGAFLVDGDQFTTSSDLISGSAEAGPMQRVLGGTTFATMGLRYLNISDGYDIRFTSFGIWDDYVRTDNQLLALQFKLGGRWQWKRFHFSAAFAGGMGGNRGREERYWSYNLPRSFDNLQYNFTTLSELMADVQLDVTEHTGLMIGFQGLLVDKVLMSRHSYSRSGDPNEARYAGLTLGIRHEF